MIFFWILCGVQYSDGDDAYFYHYTTTMGFFEYLGWRYQTWVGRLAGEALVYVTFHMGLWFWRVVDSVMLVLLPVGVLRLACKTVGYRGYLDFLAADGGVLHGAGLVWNTVRFPVLAASAYLLMSVMTFGYAAVWVNGSIFYTWTFTAGVWAMMPLADAAFRTGAPSWKKTLGAVLCSVVAAMSIEQMGAVLLAFEALAVCCIFWKKRKMGGSFFGCVRAVPAGIWIQTAVTAAAFAVLFAAPGNGARVEAEIATWLPAYRELSFGQHFFLTAQWLLSSFANEGKLFFVGIWAGGILLLQGKTSAGKKQNDTKRPREADIPARVWQAAAGVFLAAALLPYVGVHALSDMGIGNINIEECLIELPSWQSMTAANRAAFFWWLAAVAFTLAFVWKATGRSVLCAMVYLGGIASEAILFFSPTMYASGARIYYLTDLMYLFFMLWMALHFDGERKKTAYVVVFLLLGVINFFSQYSVMLLKL